MYNYFVDPFGVRLTRCTIFLRNDYLYMLLELFHNYWSFVQSLEDVDVYSFGHLIFEMSMGEPLKETTCDNAVLNCHPEVREYRNSNSWSSNR